MIPRTRTPEQIYNSHVAIFDTEADHAISWGQQEGRVEESVNSYRATMIELAELEGKLLKRELPRIPYEERIQGLRRRTEDLFRVLLNNYGTEQEKKRFMQSGAPQ